MCVDRFCLSAAYPDRIDDIRIYYRISYSFFSIQNAHVWVPSAKAFLTVFGDASVRTFPYFDRDSIFDLFVVRHLYYDR